jgi:hypothetical protein
MYYHNNEWQDAAEFVRDWRVSGALMQKLDYATLQNIMARIAFNGGRSTHYSPNPRAITEACVEALDDSGLDLSQPSPLETVDSFTSDSTAESLNIYWKESRLKKRPTS